MEIGREGERDRREREGGTEGRRERSVTKIGRDGERYRGNRESGPARGRE